jgi:transcription elongation factor GreA
MHSRIPITVNGAKKLREELDHLKREVRPKIVAAIAEARAHGDLKENAEYHAAKEQQGLTEARIRDIEHKLANAQVIDITKIPQHGKVVFGATIHLINLNNPKEELVYQIVGDDEAEVKVGKISIHSPIARALIGKKQNDTIELRMANETIEYEIIDIEYV